MAGPYGAQSFPAARRLDSQEEALQNIQAAIALHLEPKIGTIHQISLQ
jgi:hypothetical protein